MLTGKLQREPIVAFRALIVFGEWEGEVDGFSAVAAVSDYGLRWFGFVGWVGDFLSVFSDGDFRIPGEFFYVWDAGVGVDAEVVLFCASQDVLNEIGLDGRCG